MESGCLAARVRGEILTSDGPMDTCIGPHDFKMKQHIYIHLPAWPCLEIWLRSQPPLENHSNAIPPTIKQNKTTNKQRVSKMQGAEMEDEGSVLKYMTKSEIEEQRSSLLIMTQRHFCIPPTKRWT